MTQTCHKPASTSPHGRRSWLATGLLPILTLLPACSSTKHINPSFPLTVQQAKADLKQMCDDPVTLDRPVVVLGGWGDMLGMPPAHLAKQLRAATGDDRIISIGFGGCLTFDACRKRVLKRIDKAFPPDSDGWTTEVDVIGFSMGGIVARYTAASPPPPEAPEGSHPPPETLAPSTEASTITSSPTEEANITPVRRLHINRLYTICTPHRGALMSTVIAPGQLARNMKPGSEFMQKLDHHLASADFPITPYARLNDLTVGEANAAPLEQHPYWVPPAPFTIPHADAYRDPRLIADIARRLRNETPYTTQPAAALPE
jgi:pimeloyl-ACP methyl ester carboxylesterase